MIHNCCVHGPEYRDDRFLEIDEAIDAGWGSVKWEVIEKEKRKNGGVLPCIKEEPEQQPAEVAEIIASLQSGEVTFQTAVYEAVSSGYSNSRNIADAFGWLTHRVSAALSTLTVKGEIRPLNRGLRRRTEYEVVKGGPPRHLAVYEPQPKHDITSVLDSVRLGTMTRLDATYWAVCAGYSTSAEIASLMGDSSVRPSSAFLTRLTQYGRIRIKAQVKCSGRTGMRNIYERADQAEIAA